MGMTKRLLILQEDRDEFQREIKNKEEEETGDGVDSE